MGSQLWWIHILSPHLHWEYCHGKEWLISVGLLKLVRTERDLELSGLERRPDLISISKAIESPVAKK